MSTTNDRPVTVFRLVKSPPKEALLGMLYGNPDTVYTAMFRTQVLAGRAATFADKAALAADEGDADAARAAAAEASEAADLAFTAWGETVLHFRDVPADDFFYQIAEEAARDAWHAFEYAERAAVKAQEHADSI